MGVALCLGVGAWAMPAEAQRTEENASREAEDGFGKSVGSESIGIYASGEVRGFSATAAGNNRIEGLYFDRQASVTNTIVRGSTVRVGLSGFGYPFPAPTGIVDLDLRRAGQRPVVSVQLNSGDYLGTDLVIDAAIPVTDRLGINLDLGLYDDEYVYGGGGWYVSYGGIARWHPIDAVEVTGFFGRYDFGDEEQEPVIYTAGDFLPPEVERRHYYGQDWADSRSRCPCPSSQPCNCLLYSWRLRGAWTANDRKSLSAHLGPSRLRGFADAALNARCGKASRSAGTASPANRLSMQARGMPAPEGRRHQLGFAGRQIERQQMTLEGKSLAILIAPRGTEEPEFVQPKQAVEEAGAEVTIISLESGTAKTNNKDLDPDGEYTINKTFADVSADAFDGLIIPGGCVGADKLRAAEEAVAFVKAFFEQKKPVAVICHGPWLLVEADVVDGRRLTSFSSIRTDIENAGGSWVDEEVVVDRGLVTSRKPDDLPAFCAKLVEEFAEGRHADA